jgi:hypothetical protein
MPTYRLAAIPADNSWAPSGEANSGKGSTPNAVSPYLHYKAFTEVLSYWEDRTKFLIAGNLTTGVAKQQALTDPEREDQYIGLLSGDYLMVPQKHTADQAKELPNLDLVQGYLVRKDADQSVPLETRAQAAVQGITYASMRVSVTPLQPSVSKTAFPCSQRGFSLPILADLGVPHLPAAVSASLP